MEKECIFCEIIKGEIPCEKVYEDDNFIGILDIEPEVEGHILVIPKKHFGSFLDTPSSLGGEFFDAIKNIGLKLIKNKEADGFNIVFNTNESAGQVVKHVHAHILPRKIGDNRKLGVKGGLKDN
jgi:histidine triad (HIT) family protein